MVEIICAVIAGVASIVVAITSAKVSKTAKEIQKRDARRKEEAELSLQLMMTCVDLAEVSANALTGGRNNGNVEKAKEDAIKARIKYRQFERSVVSEELA